MAHDVEQPARRGDHQVGAAAQRQQLRIDRDTAVERLHPQRFSGRAGLAHGEVLQQFSRLLRELARGHQHQRAQLALVAAHGQARELVQQRQGVGCGLARAGLGLRLDIAAAQDGGNGFGLDRGGRGEAELAGSVDQRGGQSEGGK